MKRDIVIRGGPPPPRMFPVAAAIVVFLCWIGRHGMVALTIPMPESMLPRGAGADRPYLSRMMPTAARDVGGGGGGGGGESGGRGAPVEAGPPSRRGGEGHRSEYFTLPRIYVGPIGAASTGGPPKLLHEGARVELNPDQVHYLTNVLRLRPSRGIDDCEPRVRVFDGLNGEWLGRLETEATGPDSPGYGGGRRRRGGRGRGRPPDEEVFVRCTERLRSQGDCVTATAATAPWIIFAPIKRNRAKMLVEKCTELGVGAMMPVTTDRTERSNVAAVTTSSGLEKLRLQAVEASEQSERLTVPLILRNPLETLAGLDGEAGMPKGRPGGGNDDAGDEEGGRCWNLDELLDRWESTPFGEGRRLLVCRERGTGVVGTTSVLDALLLDDGKSPQEDDDCVAFLVGPEGGWSPREESLFDRRDVYPFVESISLGRTVLRAETAAMMCVGAWGLRRAQQRGPAS